MRLPAVSASSVGNSSRASSVRVITLLLRASSMLDAGKGGTFARSLLLYLNIINLLNFINLQGTEKLLLALLKHLNKILFHKLEV